MKIADVIDAQKLKDKDTSSYERERWCYLLHNHVMTKLAIKKLYRSWYKATGKKIRNRKFRSMFFVEEWEKTVDNRINDSGGIGIKEQKFREIIEKRESI